MTQIGNVSSIIEVKKELDKLRDARLIKKWELPYENLLTRVSAAIFFITIDSSADPSIIWAELEKFPGFTYRQNNERVLSKLDWRVEFNRDVTL